MCDSNSFLLDLTQIADWQLNPNRAKVNGIYAEVPLFQRGLVWNAAQIEVLWDSLFRGIPIGALSLLPDDGAGRFAKSGNASRNTYWILDGQQRVNAITLGFKPYEAGDDKNEPLLWIDLLPSTEIKNASNRKFFFYLTTPGRPWGYAISDRNGENSSGNVSVAEYRAALDEAHFDFRLARKPSVSSLWPVKAGLPVPFSVFREYAESGTDGIVAFLKKSDTRWGNANWLAHLAKTLDGGADVNIVEENAEEIKERFRCVLKTHITVLVAPKTLGYGSAHDGKDVADADRDSEIAVYFARLNRSGTAPSPEDLNYSILKSVNPVLGAIDGYAGNRMHPSRMAHIAMRVFKSSRGKWARDISRRDAYELGRDSSFVEFVRDSEQVEPAFKVDLDNVDGWLRRSEALPEGLPPVLLTTFSRRNPNLYSFLVSLAGIARTQGTVIDRRNLLAFVTLVAWFGNDGALDYASFHDKMREKDSEFRTVLQGWLFEQIERGQLAVPPPVEVMDGIVNSLATKSMEAVRSAWSVEPHAHPLRLMWYWNGAPGRGLLLYACREYLERAFGDYDPASVVWNEDNSPWDYDHVYPSNWLISGRGNRQGTYHELVHEFINSIGNIAPIPFSQNRSKRDEAPGVDYLGSVEKQRAVFIDEDFGSCRFFKDRPKCRVETDKNMAFELAECAARRMRAIYGEWLALPVFELLDFSNIDGMRRKMVDEVGTMLAERGVRHLPKTVYMMPNGLQEEANERWDFARPHLAVGFETDENGKTIKCFPCVLEQNGIFQVGLRRHPNEKDVGGKAIWWVDGWLWVFNNLDAAIEEFGRVLDKLGIGAE